MDGFSTTFIAITISLATFSKFPLRKCLLAAFFIGFRKQGSRSKFVHAIEAGALDHWPGKKRIYLSWQSLEKELQAVLKGAKRIAMEYSPRNAIPYVSRVDAGTIELIRSFGIEVVSSGDFLPHFTAVLTEKQAKSHKRAAQ